MFTFICVEPNYTLERKEINYNVLSLPEYVIQ